MANGSRDRQNEANMPGAQGLPGQTADKTSRPMMPSPAEPVALDRHERINPKQGKE